MISLNVDDVFPYRNDLLINISLYIIIIIPKVVIVSLENLVLNTLICFKCHKYYVGGDIR